MSILHTTHLGTTHAFMYFEDQGLAPPSHGLVGLHIKIKSNPILKLNKPQLNQTKEMQYYLIQLVCSCY